MRGEHLPGGGGAAMLVLVSRQQDVTWAVGHGPALPSAGKGRRPANPLSARQSRSMSHSPGDVLLP